MKSSAWLFGTLTGLLIVSACSDSERPKGPPGSTDGGDGSGGVSAKAGSNSAQAGDEADCGSTDGEAGSPTSAGEGGSAGNVAGSSVGGSAGSEPGNGYAGAPNPPVGDPPLCDPAAQFEAGIALAISDAGDDLLQAITPNELTIAWKNGDAFYIADRDDWGLPFGTRMEVAGGSQYSAVGLSPDGLLLVGVRKDLSVIEMVRGVGEAFDDPSPGEGDFEEFNNTLGTIPYADQALTDAVVAANDASFFFSHFVTSYAGSRATIYESYRDGGFWSFSSPNLGTLLYASDEQRRIPTGVSSDLLTLFYRDEIEGDFRAAWRVNTQVPFDSSEVLALGGGVQAVAPNTDCNRLYFSAQGSAGLDLFVASAAE